MAFARNRHCSLTLPNGKVAVIGGYNDANGPLSSAEIYNPSSNSWSGGGAMSNNRYSFASVLLPNGQILVDGGQSSVGTLSKTELYDYTTNTWTPSAVMNNVRELHTATLLANGTVLAPTGAVQNSSGFIDVTNTAELYNSGITVANVVAVNSGNNQATPAGSAVSNAISVLVTYQSGVAVVPGTIVTFSVASGGGSVTGGTAITDVNGIATLGTWKLGTTPGANTLSVASGGSQPVIFTATGLPGPAATIIITSGNNQSIPAGTAVGTPLSVQVQDAVGNNVVDGTSVKFTVITGGGAITGASATTSGGIATLGSWTLGTVAGTNTLSVTCGVAPAATFTASSTPGAPNVITILAGNNQSAAVGNSVPVAPSVKVQDQFGNNVADGTNVNFTVIGGGSSVTGGSQTTTSGVATLGSWQLGHVAGSNSLKVVSGAAQVILTAVGLPGSPSAITILNGNNQSAIAGLAVAIPPSVQVVDLYGNPVSDGTQQVTFAVTGGGGAVTGSKPSTIGGVATVGNWSMGKTAGVNTLGVTSFGASPVTFTANSTPNTPPVIISGPTATPSTVVVRQAIALGVAASDVDNEVLAISWAFGDGSTGTDLSTTHVYTAPGIYTVTVSVLDTVNPAVTGSVQVTVTPAIALIGFGPDSDGDGFSDAFETAAGTNPNDASSTPTGSTIGAANIGVLMISKGQINLNFAKSGNDSIALGGTLSVPQGFAPFNSVVMIDVGGVFRKFTLVNNHPVKQGTSTFSLS